MGGLPSAKIKLPSLKMPSAKKDRYPIGIDIGSHAIKICQVAKTGDDFALLGLGSTKLPEGAVEDGILQEPEEVAKIRIVVSSASHPYFFAKMAVMAAVGMEAWRTTIWCHRVGN